VNGTSADEPSDAVDGAGPRVWLLAAALFLAAFWPILAVRFHFYLETPRYSHCVLLPVVSALWVWDRWDRVCAIPSAPSARGAVALAISVALFVYGRLVHTNLVQHVAMLAAAASVVWTIGGRPLLRGLAFPLAYVALMVPLPKTWDDAITLPLQGIATSLAQSFFEALGWTVVRDGNVLQLPGTRLLVEEGCSGVHSLYALVALAVAWVAFVERPLWLRVALVAATLPVTVVANAVRVAGTGVLAHKVDPSWAQGASHTTAGLVVFAIGLALLLGLDWLLKPAAPAAGDDAVRAA
jgi:exosortase